MKVTGTILQGVCGLWIKKKRKAKAFTALTNRGSKTADTQWRRKIKKTELILKWRLSRSYAAESEFLWCHVFSLIAEMLKGSSYDMMFAPYFTAGHDEMIKSSFFNDASGKIQAKCERRNSCWSTVNLECELWAGLSIVHRADIITRIAIYLKSATWLETLESYCIISTEWPHWW